MKQSEPAVREQVVVVCPDDHEIVDARVEAAHGVVWFRCSRGDWFRYVRVGDKYTEGMRMACAPGVQS